MGRRRSTPRRGGQPPRRGDGVPPLPPVLDAAAEPATPAPPVRRTGRRPFDFGGPVWRWLLVGAFVVLLALLVGPAIGAAILVAEGEPVGEYLEAMGDWTVKVIGGLIGLGVIALMRRQGTTQRSQKTTSENQFATAQRVDTIARHVAALDARHEALAGSVADALRTVTELQAGARDAEAGGRIAAAVAHLEDLLDFAGRTGPLAVVPAAAPPAPPAPEPTPPPEPPAPAVVVQEVVTATVVRVERHADTLPPLRPLPAAATAEGQLRPITGPVVLHAEDVAEHDVEVLDPRLAAEEERRQSAWGPAGRPAWADGRGAERSAEEPADALAALLGRPRARDAQPSTPSSVMRAVEALEAKYGVDEEPRRGY